MEQRRNADRLGWRRKFGVIVPSTNTIVEPEFHAMAVPGVTPHMSRIHIRDMHFPDDEGMVRLLEQIRAEIGHAVDRVMTARPDYMVMGMSAETFWDGLEGNRQFVKMIKERSDGLDVATGAEGCERALKLFGAKRIGVITPYQPIGDENVVKFFSESGYDIGEVHGLRCENTTDAIAGTPFSDVFEAVQKIDREDVDAIVQVGTNLSTSDVFPTIEKMLGKPVLPINIATAWHALRACGVDDRFDGLGRLFEEF